MREYHELKSRHSPAVPVADMRNVTAVLDGQQRLTALNIGLLGHLAIRKKFGRANDPSAYPQRYLHLDVAYDPSQDDDDALYRFEFLTYAEASRPGDATWFRVGDVLDLEEGPGILRWVREHGLAEHPSAFETLDRLWRAVHIREAISFFEHESDSIDRVLEIFIRTNSGGTVLSKSDLLLSVATAQFTQLDARSAVHGLVDDLNAVGQGFAFTKDNVLKAGLMITDRQAIRFRVDAFTSDNVAVLEARWGDIENALRVGAQLLASFGFSERTLSASSVLLPISDYLAQRRFGQEYVTSPSHRDDRERIRRWVTRSLLKQGIWGSGLDTLLTRLRRAIRTHGHDGFPVAALEQEMAALGKSLALTSIEIEELVELPIGNRRAFPLLALLYPGVDVRNEFHMDHIFPRSAFAARRLREAGIDETLHDEYQDLRDRLPNLQLLEGPINVSKQAELPAPWIRGYQTDPRARAGWLAAHDLTDLPEYMDGFLDFYEKRRAAMFERLSKLLGADGTPAEKSIPPRPEIDGPLRFAPPGRVEPAPTAKLPPVMPPTFETEPAVPSPPATPEPVIRSGGRTDHRGRPAKQSFKRRLPEVGDGEIIYRYRGTEHRAVIVGDTITLADGRVFRSPSSAASALNGGVSTNGWKAWTRHGVTIGEIVDRARRRDR